MLSYHHRTEAVRPVDLCCRIIIVPKPCARRPFVRLWRGDNEQLSQMIAPTRSLACAAEHGINIVRILALIVKADIILLRLLSPVAWPAAVAKFPTKCTDSTDLLCTLINNDDFFGKLFNALIISGYKVCGFFLFPLC
jgi:hypothetical protein